MRLRKPADRSSRRIAFLAGILAFVYSVLPSLTALHQAEHFTEKLAQIEQRTEAIATGVDLVRDTQRSCEICQSAARSKHTGALAHQPVTYIHGEASTVVIARHEPRELGGRSPPSVRAPPLA